MITTIERHSAIARITVRRSEQPTDPEKQALVDRVKALETALAKLDASFKPPGPPPVR